MTNPKLPLPAPLHGAEIGSFAHNTIIVRLPDIARRTLAENTFPPIVVEQINQLIAALPNGRIRALTDGADWDAYTAVYEGQDWLTPPWFFSETYFYRRMMEAVGYIEASGNIEAGQPAAIDPFAYQKQHGLQTTMPATRALAAKLSSWLAQGWDNKVFGQLLAIDLWGNQADLSLWPADKGEKPTHTDTAVQQEHLIVDDTTAVADYLTKRLETTRLGTIRLDFIIDNAGFELVCDLALADYVLSVNAVKAVRFHLKIHPTFVSDALIQDVKATIAFLTKDADEKVQELGERLAGHVANGHLQLHTHPYWTSPLPGWEMPADLRNELAAASLLISKGDANYRRLLGDRHWPFETPFTQIVSYLPAPLVALRTLKSPVAVGLDTAQSAQLDQKDHDWQINGRWGLIQFSDGNRR